MYKLRNISCSYPSSIRPVLEIDELDISDNEIVFFVGPSGVGKSTILETLGLMNNTIKSEKDSIFDFQIDGKRLDMRNIWTQSEVTLSKIRNDFFSFIFQENNLFHSLSGMKNAITSSIIQGRSTKESINRVNKVREQILSDINLDKKTNDFQITSISGGQRQRLSFIRAIVTDYKVLFADEPTGNLDWLNAELLMKFLIDNMHQDSSAIIVSHDIDLALNFADKIIYLEKKSEIINGKPYYYGQINKETVYVKRSQDKTLWQNDRDKYSTNDLKKLIRDRFRYADRMTKATD